MVTRPEIQVNGTPTVQIQDTKVLIKQLVVDDHDLAEYLAAAKDQIQAIVEALRLGVRILRLAGTSGDVEMVKRQFDAMIASISRNVEKVLEEAEKGVSDRLTKFSAEELQKSLDSHRKEVNEELIRLFGPESANSVQRQIDKVLEAQAKLYRQELAQVLERTDDPENPLFKLRSELKGKADEAVKEVRDLRDKVLEIVGQAKGVASEREKGTAKGRTYQELVFEYVECLASHFGDTAVNVGDQTGFKGQSKAGDVAVEISPVETSNTPLRMVFEARDRAGTTVPKLRDDLTEAKENRGAVSAVAVFSSAEYLPTAVGLWRCYPDVGFVCVLDKDAPDPIMLEFSYRCARYEALRTLAATEAKLDVVEVGKIINSVRGRLGVIQQIKAKLSGASTAIAEVETMIDDHRKGIREDLERLDDLLAVACQSADEPAA